MRLPSHADMMAEMKRAQAQNQEKKLSRGDKVRALIGATGPAYGRGRPTSQPESEELAYVDSLSPQSGQARSYADGHGITVAEFLESKRRREAPPARAHAHIPENRAPMKRSFLTNDRSTRNENNFQGTDAFVGMRFRK